MDTPCYVFDGEEFSARAERITKALPGIPLTYSIKANPFLIEALPDAISHVEVCSPGELEICEALGVSPSRIIYSGVMKEASDIHEAISYGVDILTCESVRHAELIQQEGKDVKVLLRLTSGNQFGMSLEDIQRIIDGQNRDFSHLNVLGIHYYSGTQKTLRKLKKDLEKLENALETLKEQCDFVPSLVEYGPGLSVEYFTENWKEQEQEHLEEAAGELLAFHERYPLGIEMGRYLAASSGTYYTKVMDLKSSYDSNYAILDGGIHHLNYYGQRMAMEVPPITWMGGREAAEQKQYCLCGSLCTVADVLVRDVSLPELAVGDILAFSHCGAYSVTEAPGLFLSRQMPSIYLKKNGEEILLRDHIHTSRLNRKL